MHNNSYEILKTKSLIGKDLHQSKKDYSMVGNLDGLMLAPKIKYCIVIDENGKLSQKQLSEDLIKTWRHWNLKTFLIWREMKRFRVNQSWIGKKIFMELESLIELFNGCSVITIKYAVPPIASWQCTANNWGYVWSSEPQTLRQALTLSMSFYKHRFDNRRRKREKISFCIHGILPALWFIHAFRV